MNCPCGSGLQYSACCAPYFSGEEWPESAEKLMRSRYAAFATKTLPYLKESLDPQNRHDFDEKATREWAEQAEFTGLEILKAEEKGNKGLVEFKAHFRVQGQDHVHHETSTFRKHQGQWFYKSGKVHPTPPPQA